MNGKLKLVMVWLPLLVLLSACQSDNGTPPMSAGKWTWVSGSYMRNQAGIY
jgi:hypothetical protein